MEYLDGVNKIREDMQIALGNGIKNFSLEHGK